MDVTRWLRDLDLERYVPAFRENDIDAEVLPKLTAEDLICIGVTSVGHRRKLLDAIASLGMEVPAAAATAPAPGHGAPPSAEYLFKHALVQDAAYGTLLLRTRRQLPNFTKEHLMAVTLYSGFVPVCVQLLTGLKTVLKKAEDHATTQKWDTAVVLNLRFYPDMFPLERQVRQVCNHALGAARVAGVGLPSLPDQDNSFAEMQSRIDKVIDCLKGLRPDQVDGKDDAKVTVTIGGQPQELSGQNYLYHFAILQVQFHATTAYDILRSTGVNIGKRDYLGPRPT